MPWRTLELSESWPMGNNTLCVTTIAMFAPEKMSESLGHGEHPENNKALTVRGSGNQQRLYLALHDTR